jgi:hypothetical protein
VGIWKTTDATLYMLTSITSTAKVGYVVEAAWEFIADINWTDTLNGSANSSDFITLATEVVTNDDIKFSRQDIVNWIDNCRIIVTPTDASKIARMEYFYTAFKARTPAYATITAAMAVEDMLTYCLTNTHADTSNYTTNISDSFTTWYKTQRDAVISNSNWANAYASGSEPYFNQLFYDESAGDATNNLRNTLPVELAEQTK